MKAYMGYSRVAGSREGAVLIFANTAKEARKLAWWSVVGSDIAENYLDVAVRWLKNEPWLFKEMPIRDSPCVVEDPKICTECELWGNGEVGEDGVCSGCKEIMTYPTTLNQKLEGGER